MEEMNTKKTNKEDNSKKLIVVYKSKYNPSQDNLYRPVSVLQMPDSDTEPSLPIMMFNPDFRSSSPHPVLKPLNPVPGVPLGLEFLIFLDYILVKNRPEISEMFISIDALNSYDILDVKGQRIYYANEKVDGTSTRCLGSIRPFSISIMDYNGRIVLQIERPFDWRLYCTMLPCLCCICGSIGGITTVNLPNGSRLGKIVHKYGCYRPIYDVLDSNGESIMKIIGPSGADCCLYNLCRWEKLVDFSIILTSNGSEIGHIQKRREITVGEIEDNPEREFDFENFGFMVSHDLNTTWKALILAASFLINFTYYESPPGHDRRDRLRSQVVKNKRYKNNLLLV